MDITETIKQIKRSFRLYMNGTASQSMREKGVTNMLNWGISQVDLRGLAKQYTKNVELAKALWKENVRECKIMATLLMPTEDFTEAMAVEWGNSINSLEMAEISAFNLFKNLPYAAYLVNELILGGTFQRACAYHLLSRVLKDGKQCIDGINLIFWEIAKKDIKKAEISLLRPLINCMQCIMTIEEKFSTQASEVLALGGFEPF